MGHGTRNWFGRPETARDRFSVANCVYWWVSVCPLCVSACLSVSLQATDRVANGNLHAHPPGPRILLCGHLTASSPMEATGGSCPREWRQQGEVILANGGNRGPRKLIPQIGGRACNVLLRGNKRCHFYLIMWSVWSLFWEGSLNMAPGGVGV